MGPSRLISPVGVVLLFLSPAYSAESALRFTKIFGGSGNESVSAMVTDPAGFVILAGQTSSYDFPVTDGSLNTGTQFAVTADSGLTWRPLSNLPSGTPTVIAVDSSTSPIWYAAGTTGIFKSTDGGATWQPTGSLGLPECNYVAPFCGVNKLVIHPTQPATLYAIVGARILKSTDAGASWNPLPAPFQNPNSPSSLALDPFHPDHLFTSIIGLDFRSFDGGQTWTRFTPPLVHPGDTCGSGFLTIAFDAVTPNIMYSAEHCDLYRSVDGGVNWDALQVPTRDVFGVVTDPKRAGLIYVPGGDGVYSSQDRGTTWKRLLPKDAQFETPRFLSIDPAKPSTVIAGVFRTQDGGEIWSPLQLGRLASTIVFDASTPGRAIAATSGASAAWLAKLDSAGGIRIATYFGGQGTTTIYGIASDREGHLYVTGTTTSPDFPVTPDAYVKTAPGPNAVAFAARFDPDLKLVYSTYLVSSAMRPSAIAVDANGNAVVAGLASATSGASQCFVTKLNSAGSNSLFYRTFGGSQGNWCVSVAADGAGNSIVAGNTFSYDFPLAGGGLQTSSHGDVDAIVVKLDADGNTLYSGYLGGAARDEAASVAVDQAGNIYVAGTTASTNFPITSGAWQTSLRANCPYPSSSVITGLIGSITSYRMDDAFVTKLDPDGNLISSTYLGAGCYDALRAIALDAEGNVWVAGRTNSDPFPQVTPFETGPRYAYYKAFVAQLDADLRSLKVSSYISGADNLAADAFGNIYLGSATTIPQSPYSGLPVPPAVVAGVHAAISKLRPQFPNAVSIRSVGNAFTLRSGPVSAGQITLIAVDGVAPVDPVDLTFTPSAPLPRMLAGTQVLFDGEPAVLISVTAGRVVAIAPYSLAGKSRSAVQVVFGSVASPPVLAEVRPDAGYLSLDGSGTGQVYARNPDGTLNSPQNPAPENAPVTVYLTGTGVVDPACPEGGVAAGETHLPFGTSTIPGSVCGLLQATITTPAYGPLAKVPLSDSALTYSVK